MITIWIFDDSPYSKYIMSNGHHFNKKLLDFALSGGKRKVSKEDVMRIAEQNNGWYSYDLDYMANMCAEVMGDNIEDVVKFAMRVVKSDIYCNGGCFDLFVARCESEEREIPWEGM